ncbi:DNA repair protein RecN [uncultured Rikenella sp.]|uniref:DNA repair protein RecN n=1 Tax=uncultured Rikenella sp. TaxID=368003 RepID=UPI00261902A2|nr:DNA repair protein RecN [uncultured Rikenella sp.]
MLRRLTVENYALIDHLELELDEHLNIITGETGAGKSILLGALGLLLGNKNDGSAMKDAAKNCVVEGLFSLRGLGLEPFFEEHELDYDEEVVLRRIITPAGRSRSFVGDLPAPLATVKELGGRLLDIHSQHQNLILSSEAFRTEALDTLGGNGALRAEYAGAYAEARRTRRELEVLCEAAEAGRRDEEWLRFQVEELVSAKLREGEVAELEQEQAVLAHADRIGEALGTLQRALDDEQTGILPQLKASETALSHIREQYPAAVEWGERLHSALQELKDIQSTVAVACERVEVDPERLQAVDDRLATLYSLIRKHRAADLEELIAVRDRYAARLETIEHGDEAIEAARKALAAAERRAAELAARLHEARAKVVPVFEKSVLDTLRSLGMAETVFRISLTRTLELTPSGGDEVRYLFSSNGTVAPQPVEKIASGGELSRVMLAVKVLLAKRMQLPTILFDEIDTGVSGRIADAMGQIISTLSETMQVVDITHLPQVASKGSSHFVVYKEAGRTHLRRLSAEERTREIAKMLSGAEVTAAALEQAKILLRG